MSDLIDVSGRLRKMPAEAGEPVTYSIAVGDSRIPLNEYLGKPFQETELLDTITRLTRNQ